MKTVNIKYTICKENYENIRRVLNRDDIAYIWLRIDDYIHEGANIYMICYPFLRVILEKDKEDCEIWNVVDTCSSYQIESILEDIKEKYNLGDIYLSSLGMFETLSYEYEDLEPIIIIGVDIGLQDALE